MSNDTWRAEDSIIFELLEEVRSSGLTNMLSFSGVRQAAEDLGDMEPLIDWLDTLKPGEYGRFLMGPFNAYLLDGGKPRGVA